MFYPEMSANPSRSFATVPTSGGGRGHDRSGLRVSFRARGQFSDCGHEETRVQFGGNFSAVSGASISLPSALEADLLRVSEAFPSLQQPSAVLSPFILPRHNSDTPRSEYMQAHKFKQSVTDLAASLNEAKRNMKKVEKDT